jgi:predicted helicase
VEKKIIGGFMTKSMVWAKIILETFLEESGINDRIKLGDQKARILEGIMRTRTAGWTVVKQAEEFNISVDTVNKYIKELKELYDQTQKHSLILPVRQMTKREKELDRII